MDILTKEKLTELYINQKMSLQDIADKYDCTRTRVKQIMDDVGIQARSRSNARVIAIKKDKFERFTSHDVDESFFKIWSPEMAWVLGLIYTDGCAFPGRVAINSIDLDMLENVRTCMKGTREIKCVPQSYNKDKFIYRYEFYRENLTNDLRSIGLTPNKSLTMEFPDVPREYMRHFIRGCWDGDGSVYITANKLRASYVCGSIKFIEKLVDELYRIGIHTNKKRITDKSINVSYDLYPNGQYPIRIYFANRTEKTSYDIKIDSEDNLKRLFNYMYDNVDESIYLKRKYSKFIEGLNIKTLKDAKSKNMQREILEKKLIEGFEILKNKPNKRGMKIRNNTKYKCKICNTIKETMVVTDKIYCCDCYEKEIELIRQAPLGF